MARGTSEIPSSSAMEMALGLAALLTLGEQNMILSIVLSSYLVTDGLMVHRLSELLIETGRRIFVTRE
ncbi:hypothetical protein A2872_01480 [Candidatus Gottesmanbacteria bacterium RIFCSPHIGHO2_01_FULL_42_12]|uniref:Uncharacterized protein n=1 Tax=Candidatus Gottesmanbacteria bacterium RIFCSPHIGHO2_01_FULL_42_12 TaxID=1798377 RepID=A0A1F5Z475_9BACT|nr:MAG: hypothetical protein A2872_01480 [Candidatus Gottesmanbacteria bacterium RIFCSPHIGHO2_01_FULL_42_12]